MDAASELREGLACFSAQFRDEFAAADTEQGLRAARAQHLGKTGELTRLLRLMGKVGPDDKKELGARVNQVRLAVETAFEERLQSLARAARDAELQAPPFDLTLPGRVMAPRGHVHPLTQVKHEILDIFRSLGFEPAWGPEVDFEENNFTKLAFPPDHPAMDMQDTFWVDVAGSPGLPTLLRCHTSTVQVREMNRRQPPLAVVSGGAVYRRDDDVTHSPMFHQIEGFLIDEGVQFAHLRGVLTAFTRRLYGEGTRVRFRPSYFPFVEPGAELDAGCAFCSVADGTRATCRICKGTGWLELLGCGMVHPDVLRVCGIDPERYTGFAFGMGIERVTMLRYGIPDMRLLFENDPRFLQQF